MDKIILTDCDGVLCHWNKSIKPFLLSKGYREDTAHKDDFHLSLRFKISPEEQHRVVKEFNESPWIEKLEPFADSVKYVKLLAGHGFRFIAVTSLSDAPQAKIYRTNNLLNLFGDVFDEISCLPLSKNKNEELLRWKDSGLFWIEDHEFQADAGHEAGLRTVLVDHPYNRYYTTHPYPRVSHHKPWEEIYEMICEVYQIS